MTITKFKKEFAELASLIPTEGPNTGQWKKVLDLVTELKQPVVTKVKATSS